ncbi:apolipoprotein N-acyltransferase [Alteromonas sp. ASW11-130]|uniref:apolipoprotein N-acyltransferase n=1 Tax=Alteromonas sp. ASW11-130 TaxID=3015775 RepID=UPI002241D72F|nr:apolipoprotein N-acyltransferase [Alteromonas sp. ASW11-130]MCW8090706.1 apolipoprotein N-acyltransferase [Alteromonas sp. ASW11-130]
MLPHALTLLSGASLTFAFAPFHLWPVTFLAVAIAVYQLARSKNGFLTGWLFGFGWFGAGISWVHVSIADYGGLPLLASIGLMALLSAYLAMYAAMSFWLTKKYFQPMLWPLALPFFWFIGEWLRSWVLTGFPWLSLGYSQLQSPISGWIPVIGETGVTALIILLSTTLAVYQFKLHWLRICIIYTVVFLSGYIASNYQWVNLDKTVQVSMVQGNIAQSLRWTPEQDRPTMKKYRKLTEPLWESDLILWPEAAIPKLEPLAIDYLVNLDKVAAKHNTSVVTGIVNYNHETKAAWNSMIVLGKKEEDAQQGNYSYFHPNRYAKHHLLPIGEFVPFEEWLRNVAPLFDLPMSSFSRGDFQQANLVANGLKLAPALCFEIAFPRQVLANVQSDTDIIVTVSNDAWFGRSHGPAQHLQIAQMRALETGKSVIRATNNGITAFINPFGEVTSRLPQFEAGSLTSPVAVTRGQTPYRFWGDLAPFTLVITLFGWALYLRKGRR